LTVVLCFNIAGPIRYLGVHISKDGELALIVVLC